MNKKFLSATLGLMLAGCVSTAPELKPAEKNTPAQEKPQTINLPPTGAIAPVENPPQIVEPKGDRETDPYDNIIQMHGAAFSEIFGDQDNIRSATEAQLFKIIGYAQLKDFYTLEDNARLCLARQWICSVEK